mmetsp:Transcript_105032/g.208811  ORF Transcript_105032/g.208811 Transcript_105032/m.208811 type:complete len:234 (-) Transcript_105032:64-765(-)
MHLLRGSYGFQDDGEQPASGGAATATDHGAMNSGTMTRSRAGGRLSASTSALRSSAADPDDVDDIVQQVRRGVAAIGRSAGPDGGELERDTEQECLEAMVSPRTRAAGLHLSRSLSEASATFFRPRGQVYQDRLALHQRRAPDQEEAPTRPLAKATVRGRYVFAGGAETQVLTGRKGCSPRDSSAPEFTASGLTLHMARRQLNAAKETSSPQNARRQGLEQDDNFCDFEAHDG